MIYAIFLDTPAWNDLYQFFAIWSAAAVALAFAIICLVCSLIDFATSPFFIDSSDKFLRWEGNDLFSSFTALFLSFVDLVTSVAILYRLLSLVISFGLLELIK